MEQRSQWSSHEEKLLALQVLVHHSASRVSNRRARWQEAGQTPAFPSHLHPRACPGQWGCGGVGGVLGCSDALEKWRGGVSVTSTPRCPWAVASLPASISPSFIRGSCHRPSLWGHSRKEDGLAGYVSPATLPWSLCPLPGSHCSAPAIGSRGPGGSLLVVFRKASGLSWPLLGVCGAGRGSGGAGDRWLGVAVFREVGSRTQVAP